MAKVAKIGKEFFVLGPKGWLNSAGQDVVVPAEHGVTFFPDEKAAEAAGYVSKGSSKPETKPEGKPEGKP